ncbi:MAG: TonB-dependent receptor [Elusimicrobiota bacterium]
MRKFGIGMFLVIILSRFVYSADFSVYSATMTVRSSLFHSAPVAATRKTFVISGEELKKNLVTTIDEAFSLIPSITFNRRGALNISSDISVRGSYFEHVLIMVDGISINEKQTGHHNLDIPVQINDIERIEVVYGPSSSLYGSGAYAGVINIITKESQKKINAGIMFGSHDLYEVNASIPLTYNGTDNIISFNKIKSSGYRRETQSDENGVSLISRHSLNNAKLSLIAGYNQKDFGANGFYGAYPSHEKLQQSFITIQSEHYINNKTTLIPKIFFKEHNDEFTLTVDNPALYINETESIAYGCDIGLSGDLDNGALRMNVSASQNDLDSSINGEYQETITAGYAGYEGEFNSLMVMCGLRDEYNDQHGNILLPHMGFGGDLTDELKWRASVSRGHSYPSFTDRYYLSPANVGTLDLKPETAWTYEAGVVHNLGLIWEANIFARDETDVIDYYLKNNKWIAGNIHLARVRGFEFNTTIKALSCETKLNYIYIDLYAAVANDYVSKYRLNYVRNNLVFDITLPKIYNVLSAFTITYNDRVNYKEYGYVDVRFSRNFGDLTAFVKGKNIFSEYYEEILGVPMPGAWWFCGLEVKL